jgi:hypothetical protein
MTRARHHSFGRLFRRTDGRVKRLAERPRSPAFPVRKPVPAEHSAVERLNVALNEQRPTAAARSALSGSSAATKPRPRVALRIFHQGGLDQDRSGGPEPRRQSLASTHGGARSALVALLGSGRSRFAGLQIRSRLEVQVRAKAALQPLLGPRFTPHLVVETVEGSVEPQTLRVRGLTRCVPATLRPSARCGITRTGGMGYPNGGCPPNPRKEREVRQRARFARKDCTNHLNTPGHPHSPYPRRLCRLGCQ